MPAAAQETSPLLGCSQRRLNVGRYRDELLSRHKIEEAMEHATSPAGTCSLYNQYGEVMLPLKRCTVTGASTECSLWEQVHEGSSAAAPETSPLQGCSQWSLNAGRCRDILLRRHKVETSPLLGCSRCFVQKIAMERHHGSCGLLQPMQEIR